MTHKKAFCSTLLAACAAIALLGFMASPAAATAYPFFDDMENIGSGNWTCDSPWGYTEQYAHSPTHSLTDSPDGSYANNANVSCKLSSLLDLSTAVKPVLSFWHKYALETNADYGHVEVSEDGGSSWQRLAFVTGQQPDWTQMRVDLAEYAGQSDVLLRFRLTSNSSTTYDGWTIDDVSIGEATTAIPYPFFDNVEDPAASEPLWLPSSWQIGTPGANGSSYSWQSNNYGGTWNALTLANAIDLSTADHPQLTFWYKNYGGYKYLEVSDSYGHGGTWEQLATYGTQADWVQAQVDLSAYQGLPQVRIRFVNNGNTGYWWYVDDIRIEDTPWPHGNLYLADATMHSVHASWDQYPWGMLLFSDFHHYEVYRGTTEEVSPGDGVLACQVFDAAVTECDDAYTILPLQYYWYRMYVVDTNGLHSVGSNSVQAVYQVPTVGYPFSDGMEAGTAHWDWGVPWGLTTQFSHGGAYAWTDSPGGSYANGVDTALATRLNLASAVKPLLTFWHRYELEANADYGHVEVSEDAGSSWVRLAFVTGQQPDWTQVRVDLAEYAGQSDVLLRFRLTSNSSTTYDGWTIDDVSIGEATTAIPYPFFDDMEDPAASEPLWLPSSWQIGTPGANGSSYCWQSTNYGGTWNALTLANAIDLSTAEQPQLTFWYKNYGGYKYLEVSDSYGHDGTWERLATYGTQADWVQAQVDLSAYQGLSQVRIRFVNNGNTGYWWYVDDISIAGGEPPPPAPDVKVNGFDGPLSVVLGTRLAVTIALDAGNGAGQPADWWVGMMRPNGIFWYNAAHKWVRSASPVSMGQYPLFDLPLTQILSTVPPVGIYTFFFVLDDNPDGVFNRVAWYDFVSVAVTSGARELDLSDQRDIFLEEIEKLMER